MGKKRDNWSNLWTAYQLYDLVQTIQEASKTKRDEIAHSVKEGVLFVAVLSLAVGLLWAVSLVSPHIYYAVQAAY